MSLFFSNFVKLDPDPHSEKLLDPVPQKMNADPQPRGEGWNFFSKYIVLSCDMRLKFKRLPYTILYLLCTIGWVILDD